MRPGILKDGAIPAKYKLLMGMITDAIAAHPAVPPYLYGGTAGLVVGLNACSANPGQDGMVTNSTGYWRSRSLLRSLATG